MRCLHDGGHGGGVLFSERERPGREQSMGWTRSGQEGTLSCSRCKSVLCVFLNNPELVEASRSGERDSLQVLPGAFYYLGLEGPLRASDGACAGRGGGGSANGDPLNLRMSRWPRERFRLPSSTSPRNIHPGPASGVLLAPSTAWHLQIGTILGPMIGSGKSCLAAPKGLLHATTFR